MRYLLLGLVAATILTASTCLGDGPDSIPLPTAPPVTYDDIRLPQNSRSRFR